MKVTWSLAGPDDPTFSTRDAQVWKTSEIIGLDLDDPETGVYTAQTLAERFFDAGRWGQIIGDATEETCHVEIHMPVEIKGRFEVDLERRVHATARKMPA